MPGTAINAINYDQNDDVAAAIEEVLQESSPQQAPPQAQQQAPPQYNPQPPVQQYQPPPQQYQQMPQQMPQQYQQGPPQMPQMPQMPQQGYYQENFQQPSAGFSFTLPDTLKKTLILLVILLLLNNASFKNVLTKIPMTVNGEGQHTFLMTIIVCLLISSIFFITTSVF